MLVYDDEDGNVRCTSCNICAKVCPPQCIWMTQAKGPKGNVVPLPEDFYIDMDVCMNCGLCSEYCPFDAIKMDQNFELSELRAAPDAHLQPAGPARLQRVLRPDPPRRLRQRRRGRRARQGRQEEGPAALEGPRRDPQGRARAEARRRAGRLRVGEEPVTPPGRWRSPPGGARRGGRCGRGRSGAARPWGRRGRGGR